MTTQFTITVSWLELAFLGTLFFAAGAYVCHSTATYRPKLDDLPPRQGEDVEL